MCVYVRGQVRSAAAISLGQMGTVATASLPALARALRSHTIARDVTCAVIAQLGPEGERYLCKCVMNPNVGVAVRVAAARGLASVPTRVLHTAKRADGIARALCGGALESPSRLRCACLQVRRGGVRVFQ